MARERTTDFATLERLVAPAGKDVVDIGCGPGALVRELTDVGARVVGVEISDAQLAPARAQDGGSGARYIIGSAQRLPLPDGSMDLAVFMRTLHHVPAPDLNLGLAEARRVLRPGGSVYVAEPLPEGSYFDLTSLVEDEREVRAAAQQALAHADRVGLERAAAVEYDLHLRMRDLAAFRARTLSANPDRAEVFNAREPEIAEAFQRLGEPGETPGERWFVQPMRAEVLRACA